MYNCLIMYYCVCLHLYNSIGRFILYYCGANILGSMTKGHLSILSTILPLNTPLFFGWFVAQIAKKDSLAFARSHLVSVLCGVLILRFVVIFSFDARKHELLERYQVLSWDYYKANFRDYEWVKKDMNSTSWMSRTKCISSSSTYHTWLAQKQMFFSTNLMYINQYIRSLPNFLLCAHVPFSFPLGENVPA